MGHDDSLTFSWCSSFGGFEHGSWDSLDVAAICFSPQPRFIVPIFGLTGESDGADTNTYQDCSRPDSMTRVSHKPVAPRPKNQHGKGACMEPCKRRLIFDIAICSYSDSTVYRFCFWLRRMLWVYLPKMDIRWNKSGLFTRISSGPTHFSSAFAPGASPARGSLRIPCIAFGLSMSTSTTHHVSTASQVPCKKETFIPLFFFFFSFSSCRCLCRSSSSSSPDVVLVLALNPPIRFWLFGPCYSHRDCRQVRSISSRPTKILACTSMTALPRKKTMKHLM